MMKPSEAAFESSMIQLETVGNGFTLRPAPDFRMRPDVFPSGDVLVFADVPALMKWLTAWAVKHYPVDPSIVDLGKPDPMAEALDAADRLEGMAATFPEGIHPDCDGDSLDRVGAAIRAERFMQDRCPDCGRPVMTSAGTCMSPACAGSIPR